MGYTSTDGTPVPVITTGSDNSLGMGGLLPLVIGGALFGGNQGGLFGGNRNGYGAGYPGVGGYYAGNVQGEQTGDLQGLRAQVSQIATTQGSDRILNEVEGLEHQVNCGFSSTKEAVCHTARDLSKDITNEARATDHILNCGFNTIRDSVNDTSRGISRDIANTQNAITNGNFTTLQSINDLGRDVSSQANQNALQQLNSFNVLGTNMNQSFNALNNTTQQGFNAVSNLTQQGFNNLGQLTQQGFNTQAFQAQAQTNQMNTTLLQGFNEVNRDSNIQTQQIIAGQSHAAAQLAECCCEIKQAVCEAGQKTDALINEIRLAELNAALTDAKTQVSNLHQTNHLNANNAAQTNVILQHITPLLAAMQNGHNGGGHHS